MLNVSEAMKIAKELVDVLNSKNKIECGLNLDDIIESEFCYAFYYQSLNYFRTKHPLDMVVGHGPILVDKRNGTLVETGSAHTAKYYIDNYENRGDPFKGPTLDVLIFRWEEGAHKIRAVRSIRRHTDLGLLDSKKAIDKCLEGAETIVTSKGVSSCKALVKDLETHGFVSRRT